MVMKGWRGRGRVFFTGYWGLSCQRTLGGLTSMGLSPGALASRSAIEGISGEEGGLHSRLLLDRSKAE